MEREQLASSMPSEEFDKVKDNEVIEKQTSYSNLLKNKSVLIPNIAVPDGNLTSLDKRAI